MNQLSLYLSHHKITSKGKKAEAVAIMKAHIGSLLYNSMVPVKKYHKIPEISPGVYVFERPFLRGLFLEGLIFGGAYVQREICVSKSTGLAIFLERNLPLFFVLLCATSPPGGGGAYIWRGDFTEGFLRYEFGGVYIWRGLYMDELIFGILRYATTISDLITFRGRDGLAK